MDKNLQEIKRVSDELLEFIDELCHNRTVNQKNNLEQKVDIDYVIDRLCNIINGE